MKRFVWALGAGLVLSVLGARAAAAQDFSLSILDKGKPVRAEVKVGDRTETTDAVGAVTFPVGLLDRGKRVDVWEMQCVDGRLQYVIVPEGTVPQDTEECKKKRRVGGFLWGEGSPAVDVGRVALVGKESLAIGVAFDLYQMTKLDDVLGDVPGVLEHDATMWAPGVEVFTEIRPWSFLAIGAEGGYSTMNTETRFAEGMQDGDLNYYELGGYARLCMPGPRALRPYGIFGLYRTWNKADFTLDGMSDHRVHKTRRDGVGAGLEYWPRTNLAFRFEGQYNSTFDDNDADTHIRWKFGLMYSPFVPREY